MKEYRSFRTGDGDKDRGTLNLMFSVGCGGVEDSRRDGGHGLGIMENVFLSSHD